MKNQPIAFSLIALLSSGGVFAATAGESTITLGSQYVKAGPDANRGHDRPSGRRTAAAGQQAG